MPLKDTALAKDFEWEMRSLVCVCGLSRAGGGWDGVAGGGYSIVGAIRSRESDCALMRFIHPAGQRMRPLSGAVGGRADRPRAFTAGGGGVRAGANAPGSGLMELLATQVRK